MTVSAIIPAHNAENTIDQAVRSALSQADQVVVVADSCTDRTIERARAFPAVEVHTIAAGSAAAARHHGVESARGEWLAFLDADDWWGPDWLAAIRRVTARDPPADMLIGRAMIVAPEAEYLGPKLPSAAGDHYATLLHRPCVTTSATVLRRHAYYDAGGFDPRLSGAGVEDFDLWLRVSASRPVAPVPGVHVYYRHAGTGGSRDATRFAQRRNESLRAINRAARLRPPGPALLRRARANVYRMSAERFASAGWTDEARSELIRAVRLWPFDPRTLEIAAATLLPPGALGQAKKLRRQLKSRLRI
ncbi:MAG: glycosyltransferase family A protein [Myxococcota bacterium]